MSDLISNLAGSVDGVSGAFRMDIRGTSISFTVIVAVLVAPRAYAPEFDGLRIISIFTVLSSSSSLFLVRKGKVNLSVYEF